MATFLGAAKSALPTAAQNFVKGSEMLARGEARDTRGQFTAKVSPLEAVGKAAGFNPNAVADRQRVTGEIRNDENFIAVTKSALMDEFVNAIRSGDRDDIESVRRKIASWNKSNPTMPIVITPQAMRRRLQLAGMSPDVRSIKLAPRPLRGEVASLLRPPREDTQE